jgi:hypothetical protein
VVTEEVILKRMSVRNGRLVLPDGMTYRVLVLPDRPNISLAVLRKLKEFVAAGATIVGPRPQYATGLTDYPKCDEEVARLATKLWGGSSGSTGVPPMNLEGSRKQDARGTGRIVWDKTARDVLKADGIGPDFEFAGKDLNLTLDYIHRRDGETDIYFVANRDPRSVRAYCTFRVQGKPPQLWDPVTGLVRGVPARAYQDTEGRTTLVLEFVPCGSMFVVFRPVAARVHVETEKPGRHEDRPLSPSPLLTFSPSFTIPGPWTVRFDPNWGGPGAVQFPELVSWTQRPQEGIKFYSGSATYETSFDLPASLLGHRPGPANPERPATRDEQRILLDLGNLRELAQVRLNGKNLGILWTPPFRMDVTDVIEPGANRLEIDVVNFWPNRIIGDQSLPPEKRLTRTNIRKLTKDTPLIESGLLGPVTLGSP